VQDASSAPLEAAEVVAPSTGASPTAAAGAPARGRGRPRAEDRTEAILTAASDLFEEVGYDQMTVQAIARRAGVGLATIYRRWPTKQALLAEALRQRRARFAGEVDGPPLEALGAIYGMLAHSTLGPKGEFLPGLLAAIRTDEELADALDAGVLEPLRRRLRRELAGLLGEGHPLLDLLADVVPGVCVYRAFAPGPAPDPDAVVAAALALVQAVASAPDAATPR
jgi:AcrR family transcriptional regulator